MLVSPVARVVARRLANSAEECPRKVTLGSGVKTTAPIQKMDIIDTESARIGWSMQIMILEHANGNNGVITVSVKMLAHIPQSMLVMINMEMPDGLVDINTKTKPSKRLREFS